MLPLTDERCPSCGEDTRAPKRDPRSRIEVHDAEMLPPLCASCGAAATTRARIGGARRLGGESTLVRVLFAVLNPVRYLMMRSRIAGVVRSVWIRVPVCADCKRADALPEIQHIDFDHDRLTLLVHDRFAAAFQGEDPSGEASGDPTYRESARRR